VRTETIVGVIVAAVVFYLVVLPLVIVAFSSVRDTTTKLPFEDTSFTLANYATVFSSGSTYVLLGNTASYAVVALVIGAGLGALFAWFLQRGAVPCRMLLTVAVLSALATPPLTDALGWSLLASPSIGLLNAGWHSVTGTSGDGPLNIYTIAGMAFVTGMKSVPSAFILFSGPIGRFDPTLEEAAAMSGASHWDSMRRVVVPLLRPAILGVVILFAILILETFEIPAVLGLPGRVFVFSSLIYDASHPAIGLPNYGLISAYGSIFLIVAAVLMLIYGRATAHAEQFAVVTGKGYRPKLLNLGVWTWVPIALVSIYFVLAVALPFLALIWTSLGLSYRQSALSSLDYANFDAYRQLLQTSRLYQAIVNTLIAATAAATATLVLGSGIAWLSIRFKGIQATAPDRLAMLSLGAPGIVVGLALLFFYAWLPLPIYGTIWIVVIALATRFLAYAVRLMSAAYVQIHRELEEAAALSGANLLDVMRRIILPLVWPSFSSGWLWVFVHVIRDATLALMLFTVSNDTLGVRLWSLWFNEGKPAQAAALAVCLAVVSGVLSLGVVRTVTVRPSSV
jgi:iron(III) transport system permease protein